MQKPWNFEDALPCLRRFASAVISGGVEPMLADQFARTSIKAVLAQKLPVADANNLRIALYKSMLMLCRRYEAREDVAAQRVPSTNIVRGLYRLSQDEREALVLVVVEGLKHVDAAKVLDLPQWVFLARLTRARENLQAELARQQTRQTSQPRSGPSHLRLVK